jgi:predicted enzyme related to lactoylglutathione lyase
MWVSSIQDQANFYSDLFGIERLQASSDYLEVGDSTNAVLLHLLPLEFRSDEVRKREDQPIKPIFEVSNIASALERVSKFKLEVGSPTQYGEFIYQDLVDREGNVIQLQQLITN